MKLLREQDAEPGHAWVRFSPTRWPAPPCAWVDVAAGALGAPSGDSAALEALLPIAVDDVLYLRPVPPVMAAARDRLAERHARRGTPVLVQVLPGDPMPEGLREAVVVVDLLPLLLARYAGAAVAPPAEGAWRGAVALWPLLPAVGNAAAAREVLPIVSRSGARWLHPVSIGLSGRQLRELAEGVEEARYLDLFHGVPPEPRAIAAIGIEHALEPLLPRPLPRPPLHGAANLRAAGELAVAAELCLWLHEAESRAHALLRAARFAERATHDLAALARDGNLAVLPWLEDEGREVVREAVIDRDERPRLVRELLGRLAG